MSGQSPTRRTFADKLNHLFAVVHPASRAEFSNVEVADAITDTGVTISPSYIWHLRRGDRDNPTLKHVEALAAFFKVDVTYFLDDAVTNRVDAELQVIAAMRDAGVRRIALRASGLSEGALTAIAGLVDNARSLEGLPDPPEEAAPPPGAAPSE